MRMFRLALAGALPAFVLLVAIQLNVGAATRPQSPTSPSWFTGDDSVNPHIWLPVGTVFNCGTHPTDHVAGPSESRQLSFADRVAYQRAIEEVYWRHRIWPRNRGERPALEAMLSQAAIVKKVQDYLRDSKSLEEEWQKPITPEQLQAEIERMAEHTKQPQVLRELFAALGNDPFVIAECLARPVLAERMINSSHVTQTKVGRSTPKAAAAAIANYTLPKVSDGGNGCIDDTWTPTTITNAPDGRYNHTAVWTGSEMIIWSGGDAINPFNTGGRYNPSTDSWSPTSTVNVPEGRIGHRAVWTGTEMIIWGGVKYYPAIYLNTGGRYNPSTDSWTATSTTGAPSERELETAVWTGSEMLVWGGFDGNAALKTGGKYNPTTNSWTDTSTTNAPSARLDHTAVWTGSEMIVWGGDDISNYFDTGGRYNPVTDTWMATSTTNAPGRRNFHTAVWTGSDMVVWGGSLVREVRNTGGKYNPFTDSWTATSTIDAPAKRADHTAVWTGREMIVWGGSFFEGGSFQYLNTGGRYNPSTDSWTATSTIDGPSGRQEHTAVWTDSEMIVWGGFSSDTSGEQFLNTGGRYCAQAVSPITLRAGRRKIGGINTVRLRWREATSSDIDVYRDGALIVTTPNDGSYIDSTGDKDRSRYTYQVCEAGTQTCSNEATVSFPR